MKSERALCISANINSRYFNIMSYITLASLKAIQMVFPGCLRWFILLPLTKKSRIIICHATTVTTGQIYHHGWPPARQQGTKSAGTPLSTSCMVTLHQTGHAYLEIRKTLTKLREHFSFRHNQQVAIKVVSHCHSCQVWKD